MSVGPSGASMKPNHSSEPGGHCINAQIASLTHHSSPGSAREAGSIVRGVHSKPAIVGTLVMTPIVPSRQGAGSNSSVGITNRFLIRIIMW